MSDQQKDPMSAFVPFVGIVSQSGAIALRRYDLIVGCDTREGLTPNDGCLVRIKGEQPIQSKLSPMNIAAQVRSCEHWVAIREMQEGLAIQEQMQRAQMNGIALPGRG